jgi:FkbM family methyltransferase
MNQKELLRQLEKVEAFATTFKFNRFLRNPVKYILSIVFSKLIVKLGNFHYDANTPVFWDQFMLISLPASVDIFLSGGKTHNSEIRLTRYLINHLHSRSVFMDIGAHFGFYSLLAAYIAEKGKVYSIEAASKSFQILHENTKDKENIAAFNIAFNETDESINFYEFPTLYSEYNTLVRNQYEREAWFEAKSIKVQRIDGKRGDSFIAGESALPEVIKIDVEGAEDIVLRGLSNYLLSHSPAIIMEFSQSNRGNDNHRLADNFLKSFGYLAHSIDEAGEPQVLTSNTHEYVDKLSMESDNIIYIKPAIRQKI